LRNLAMYLCGQRTYASAKSTSAKPAAPTDGSTAYGRGRGDSSTRQKIDVERPARPCAVALAAEAIQS
jgi:hypothetical protein